MSVVYGGQHSISFIKTNSNETNEIKNTWDDWHLIPAERPIVNPPQPALSLISIPGSSNVLDLTEVLGSINFSMRTGEWEFYVDNDQWIDWPEAFNTISQFINGQRLKCVLDDDPTKVYRGRFTFSGWKNEDSYSSVTIKYDLEYYYDTATLQSILAYFDYRGRIINQNTDRTSIKSDLIVNAVYSSGFIKKLKEHEYNITNITSDGQISISYNSLSTVAQDILNSITVSYNPGNHLAYIDESPETLRPYLTVTGTYVDGTSSEITDYKIGSGSLIPNILDYNESSATSVGSIIYGPHQETFSIVVHIPNYLYVCCLNAGNYLYHENAKRYLVSNGGVSSSQSLSKESNDYETIKLLKNSSNVHLCLAVREGSDPLAIKHNDEWIYMKNPGFYYFDFHPRITVYNEGADNEYTNVYYTVGIPDEYYNEIEEDPDNPSHDYKTYVHIFLS